MFVNRYPDPRNKMIFLHYSWICFSGAFLQMVPWDKSRSKSTIWENILGSLFPSSFSGRKSKLLNWVVVSSRFCMFNPKIGEIIQYKLRIEYVQKGLVQPPLKKQTANYYHGNPSYPPPKATPPQK